MKNLRVFYILGRRGCILAEPLNAIGLNIKISRFKGPRRLFGTIIEVVMQLVAFNKKPKVILTDQMEFVPIVWLLSKIFKTGFVLMARGDFYAEAKQVNVSSSLLIYLVKLLMKINERLLCKTKALVTVSGYLALRLSSKIQVPQNRIFTVNRSVDVEKYSHWSQLEAKRQLNWEDRKTILSVTNFRFQEKVKGMNEILPYMKTMLRGFPDMQWAIAGIKGSYFTFFKRNALEVVGSMERICFLGYVDNLPLFYAASEFLVHFTFLDAFPRVVIEAQASGRPVIANNFGGVPEMICDGETGFIVSNGKQYIEKACMLLRDKVLCDKMGRLGKKFVSERYSPVRIGKQWVTILES